MRNQTASRLILICGLPGAGKTTLARRLATEIPAVRFCPDEWMARLGADLYDEAFRERLEQQFWLLTQDLLRLGMSVILEFGFWVRSERDEKREAGRALGAAVELYFLDVPFDELWRRVAARNARGASDTVVIPRAALASYSAFFQAPDGAELALYAPHPPHKGPGAERDET